MENNFPEDSFNSTQSSNLPSKFVSDAVTDWVENVLVVVMPVICLVALVTNSVSLRVFVRQGVMADSTTLSLFCLSLSDMAAVLFLLPSIGCRIIAFSQEQTTALTCKTMTFLSTESLHHCFFSVSCWITVYMSVERSLSVLTPLKVKLYFKPKTTAVTLACFCVFFIVVNSLVASNLDIVWKTNPISNESFAIIYKSPRAEKVMQIGNAILFSGSTYVSTLIVLVATILMLYQLKKARKWRQSSSSSGAKSGNSDPKNPEASGGRQSQSNKDIELFKAVVVVTSVFLICVSVTVAASITLFLLPSLTFEHNQNIIKIMNDIKALFDATNACVNFFFFIRISSRYQATFRVLFPGCLSETT